MGRGEVIMRDLFEKEVLPKFEMHRAEWLLVARATARQLGEAKGEITINDVRRLCPPPNGVDPRVMGAVLKRPEWELIRYERSARATCHNRPVGVFRLRDASNATAS